MICRYFHQNRVCNVARSFANVTHVPETPSSLMTTTKLYGNNASFRIIDQSRMSLSTDAIDIPKVGKNGALESIKLEGMAQLDDLTRDIASKTRRPLFESVEENKPSVRQLRSAAQLLRVLEEVFERYAAKDPAVWVRGEPIEITDVEVSADLRHARVFWTLPFTMEGLPVHAIEVVTVKMQEILDQRRGKMQALVTARLRRQHPPRLRFVAENTALTHSDIALRNRPSHLNY